MADATHTTGYTTVLHPSCQALHYCTRSPSLLKCVSQRYSASVATLSFLTSSSSTPLVALWAALSTCSQPNQDSQMIAVDYGMIMMMIAAKHAHDCSYRNNGTNCCSSLWPSDAAATIPSSHFTHAAERLQSSSHPPCGALRRA